VEIDSLWQQKRKILGRALDDRQIATLSSPTLRACSLCKLMYKWWASRGVNEWHRAYNKQYSNTDGTQLLIIFSDVLKNGQLILILSNKNRE